MSCTFTHDGLHQLQRTRTRERQSRIPGYRTLNSREIQTVSVARYLSTSQRAVGAYGIAHWALCSRGGCKLTSTAFVKTGFSRNGQRRGSRKVFETGEVHCEITQEATSHKIIMRSEA
jgi:hypothetical protein